MNWRAAIWEHGLAQPDAVIVVDPECPPQTIYFDGPTITVPTQDLADRIEQARPT